MGQARYICPDNYILSCLLLHKTQRSLNSLSAITQTLILFLDTLSYLCLFNHISFHTVPPSTSLLYVSQLKVHLLESRGRARERMVQTRVNLPGHTECPAKSWNFSWERLRVTLRLMIRTTLSHWCCLIAGLDHMQSRREWAWLISSVVGRWCKHDHNVKTHVP